MRIAYFDCFSGISGDMTLGAIVDAGCDMGELEASLRKLGLTGWAISEEKVSRCGFQATGVVVDCAPEHQHRKLTEILEMIDRAGFPPKVSARATSIFQRLGEAEARVHGMPLDRVHFHEVGAVDSIVDIVGAAVGFDFLGIEEFGCSPLNLGGGWVETQHGRLPIPAPATADLLRGAPTYSTGIPRELVTPTGAAIASTLVSRFGAQPPMTVAAIGKGAGSADLPGQPNILRMFVGESAATHDTAILDEEVIVLEANLDDQNPQVYGYFAEIALGAGALDVFSTSVQMKKNRPGQLVTVLCHPAMREQMTEMLFRETTTLGIRQSIVKRRTLNREIVLVETPLGAIRMKIARLNGSIMNVAPEYEDCKKLATERGLPLKQVIAEASHQYKRLIGDTK